MTVIIAAADSDVGSSSPNQAEGSAGALRIRSEGNDRALVRFDQAAIAAFVGSQTLVSATIELTIDTPATGWDSGGLVMFPLTTAWTEAGATWNCASDLVANDLVDCASTDLWAMIGATLPPWKAHPSDVVPIVSGQTGIVSFDVTSDVAASLVAQGPDFGFVLKKQVDGTPGAVEFTSRETASAPRLILRTTIVAAAQAPPATRATMTATADTYLREPTPDRNQGTLATLRVRPSGDKRSLVQVGGLESALEGHVVVSAHLEMTIAHNSGNWDGAGVDLHRMTVPWTELGATWHCGIDSNTGNNVANCSGTSAWQMEASTSAQLPHASPASASATIANGQSGIVSFDVTSDVQAFAAGTANLGWVVKKNNDHPSGFIDFASRETASPARLNIEYTDAALDCGGESLLCDQCLQLTLSGQRIHLPLPQRIDDRQCLCRPARFEVPTHLDVVEGNAGNYEAELAFAGEAMVTCRYRGGSPVPTPSLAADVAAGERYLFLSCSDASVPGDVVDAAALELRVFGGSEPHGPTRAVVSMTEAERTPVIVVTGASEGAVLPGDVTLGIAVTAGALLEARLDGAPFVSGSAVTVEAAHTLAVRAGCGEVESTDERHFAIDRTPPSITIAGAVDGELRQTAATITASTNDLHPFSSSLTLDGQPFEGSVTASSDGLHTVVVSAIDAAGNSASQTLSFTIDQTAPSIDIAGVVNGELRNTVASIVVTVVDAHPGTTSMTLDAVPFTGTTMASSDGTHTVVVSSVDAAGNSSTRAVSFTIDRTAPAIAIDGVVDGELRNTAATVAVAVSDAHPGATTMTLDGVAFSNTVAVAIDGLHLVAVTSTDAAGNSSSASVQFTTDRTAPSIAVTGVTDGELRNSAATVTVTVDDAHPGTATMTLDGVAFAGQVEVADDAVHVVDVSAQDAAGNSATRRLTFTIDRTAPAIVILGITDGELRNSEATVAVGVFDVHPGATSMTLDGVAFVDSVSTGIDGEHVVQVTSTDAAGNESTLLQSFTIDRTAPSITIAGVADGELRGTAASILATVHDLHLGAVTMALDGVAFSGHVDVDSDGLHVVEVTAADSAGNTAIRRVTFTIDRTPPSIAIVGATEGELRNTATIIAVAANDAHPATTTMTLDGVSFSDAIAVDTDGLHVVAVTSTDAVGNASSAELRFTIDRAAPTISIDGVIDGELRNTVATVVVSIDDAHPGTATMTLDGAAFSGSVGVDSEGVHVVDVVAQDAAGNTGQRQVSFTIDRIAPSIAIVGVTDGELRNTAATIAVAVSDEHPGVTTMALDGVAFLDTVTIDLDGEHVVAVSSTDAAGNSSTQQVSFTIDRSAPLVTISGVSDGELRSGAANITVSVQDTHPTTTTMTLDGVAFVTTVSVETDGAHVVDVETRDAAGNTATKRVTFIIDRTPPSIAIVGATADELRNTAATIAVAVEDVHPGSMTATLDGVGFADTVLVATEGGHVIAVTSTDAAGNQASAELRFTIDETPPSITISGVVDGELRNTEAAVTATVNDAHGVRTTTMTLDGAPFFDAVAVSADGVHVVEVNAEDNAGNSATRRVTFTIDRTPPVIAIVGATDGELRNTPASISVIVTDAHPGTTTAALNGVPFAGNISVDEEGLQTVLVSATDAAGNESTHQLAFTIDRTAPSIAIGGVVDGELRGTAATISVTVSDVHPGTTTMMLDSIPFFGQVSVDLDGLHLVDVSSQDAAGNVAVRRVSFTIDQTSPSIAIVGAVDGELRRTAATIAVGLSEPHPGTTTMTLDGVSFTDAVTVELDGHHVVAVASTDAVGNMSTLELAFTIDRTAPSITIAGVSDGELRNTAAAVLVTVTDAHPGTATMTLDGVAFLGAIDVDGEGEHAVDVVAEDAAGNTAHRHVSFTIDRIAPSIAIVGVTDGELRNAAATIAVAVADEHPGATTMTLDGVAFPDTVSVDVDGEHVVAVSSTDAAGNSSTQEISFTIDRSAPLITIAGVVDGELRNAAASITVSVQDANSTTTTMTLDGAAFGTTVSVDTDGTHVVDVETHDAAGNTATKRVTFTIDRTPPSIAIVGATADELRNTAATIAVAVEDAHPGSMTATLDGVGFADTVLVATEGAHVIAVTSTDAAGNQASAELRFTIDQTPPSITISGVVDAELRNTEAAVTATVNDAHGVRTTTMTLDGVPFSNAVAVTADGVHVVEVNAEDNAGNSATRRVTFTIDRTPPVIEIVGATDGELRNTDASINVTVTDAHPGTTTSALNGALFGSDVSVDEEGAHTVLVNATDAAGNEASRTLSFTIDQTPPTLTIESPLEGAALEEGSVEFVVSTADEHGIAEVRAGSQLLQLGANGAYVGLVSLGFGDNDVVVSVTDLAGNVATATRHLVVDQTPPFLEVSSPAEGALLHRTPVLLQGVAGDLHLSEVTVNGDPVVLVAGSFSTSVPLSLGANTLFIRARDLAGNVTLIERHVVFDASSPVVSIFTPAEGASVTASPIHLEASVQHTVGVGVAVTMNGVPAADIGGIFAAEVPLAPGNTTITVTAVDENGFTGFATRNVSFRDLTAEPLTVVAVSPAAGAVDVEPDVIVSLSFNKPLATQDLGEKLSLKVDGTSLPLGFFTAPDGLSVSLIAKGALPEGATIDVVATDLLAAEGPPQATDFGARFSVRAALTGVVGVVLDEDLIPVRGARVSLEGTAFSATVGSDGHWGFFEVPAGVYRLLIEGGDGVDALTRIRPRAVIEGRRTTRLSPHFLTDVDASSAQQVDATLAVDIGFVGGSEGLRLRAPAGALQLRDGRTRGALSATPIAAELAPFPVEGRVGTPLLWTMQPQGARVTQPAQLTFPNPRNIAENRAVLIFALDDIRAEITLRGLGHVRNGLVEADDGIQGSLDVLGYLPLSETQESAVLARLNGTDTGDQGTFLDDLLDILKINEAHAADTDAITQAFVAVGLIPTRATLNGRVVLANRTGPSITSSPAREQSLRFSYTPLATGGEGAITFRVEGSGPSLANGVVSFTPRSNDPVTFDIVAVDAAGATSRQTIRLNVEGNGTVIHVVVTGTGSDEDTSSVGLTNVKVDVGVSGLPSGLTGLSGDFSFNVPTYGGEMDEVVIASMGLGAFPVARRDANGRMRVELVDSKLYARSPILPLFQDVVFRTVVVVDAHVLKGNVTFVDDDGVTLPPALPDVATQWDDTSRLLQVSKEDIETTECSFFKSADLERSIARLAVVSVATTVEASTGAHGSFAQRRVGPRDLNVQERRRQGQVVDERVLHSGEPLLFFCVNHATGYAGMTTTTVPEPGVLSGPPEVIGNVKLFPPEIEVEVKRQLTPKGAPQAMEPSLVRSGGLATTSDDYVTVATRWRVRLKPNAVDDADAGVLADAGFLVGEVADAGAGPGSLVDEGSAGTPLEELCSLLDDGATPRERLDCLRRDDVLVDVPPAVPPLAGHIVSMPGGTPIEAATFRIEPGKSTSTLTVARQLVDERVLPMPAGLYLTHVVGRQVAGRDLNLDNELSDQELNTPPPDFSEDPALRGFPKNAIALKGVYTARLRPESGGPARKIASYDVVREHQWRVAAISAPKVEAISGVATRELDQDDIAPTAEDGDSSLALSLLLSDPGHDVRVNDREDLEVRLGGDTFGVDCSLVHTPGTSAVTATCEHEDLAEILSAQDLVYLELIEGSNTDNVLYRYNFYGLSTRVDHVSATTTTTLDRATSVDGDRFERLNRAAHTKPNVAVFPLSVEDFGGQGGIVEILSSSQAEPLRSIDVNIGSAGELLFTGRVTDKWQGNIEKLPSSTTELVYVELPLPPSVVALRRSETPPLITASLTQVGHTKAVSVAIGRPRGRIESRAARAPGHEMFHGVDVVDGHLSFSDVDMSVPERGSQVTFARSYNNQNQEVSSVGLGWHHNHEGFIVEERSGRYSVVAAGQQLTFPACVLGAANGPTPPPCLSDQSMDATLVVQEGFGGSLRAEVEDHATGRHLRFHQASVIKQRDGRRRTLLTSINDGLADEVQYSYVAESDLVDEVKRGNSPIKLHFEYDTISEFAENLHPAILFARATLGFRRLRAVCIATTAATSCDDGVDIVDRIQLVHDLGGTTACSGGAGQLDKKLGLLLDVCRPKRAPQPHWSYRYQPLPSSATNPTAQLVLGNELSARELRVTEAGSAEGIYQQWRYTPSTTSPAAHIDAFEAIGTVLAPGESRAAKIEYTDTSTRRLTRPDDVVHELVLNNYGSVIKETRGGRVYTSTNQHDNEGPKVADAKRVLPTARTSSNGTKMEPTFETTRHRTNSTTVTPGSTAESKPRGTNASGGVTVTTEARDERFGVATQTTFPGGNGAATTATLDVSAFGAVQGVSITAGTSTVGYSMANTAEGLPTTGTGLTGDELSFTGTSPLFGQRTSSTTTHISPEPDALERITRQLDYDDLGRLNSIEEEETGRLTTWTLDALGRETERIERAAPSPDLTTTTTFKLTTTERTTESYLGGVLRRRDVLDEHRRMKRSEVPFADGVEISTYAYPRPDGLLETITGAPSGVVTTFGYDPTGKWLLTTTTTTPGAPLSRVVVARDNDGNALTSTTTDPRGRTVTTTLDKLGQAVKWNYGGNDVERVERDTQGNVVLFTWGVDETHKIETTVDQAGRITRRRSSIGVFNDTFETDGAGRTTSTTKDPSELSERYEYKDALGRMTKRVRTIHTVDDAGADQTLSTTETRAYADSSTSRTVTITETSEGPTPRTKTTTLTLDQLDRIVRVDEDLPGTAPHARTVTFDDSRQMETHLDEQTGLSTVVRFDQQGAMTSSTNAEQTVTQKTNGRGVLTSRTTTGPRTDVVWAETFDGFGERATRKLEGTSPMTTSWTYGTAGVEVETPPRGAPITRTTNGRGLLLSEVQGPRSTTFAYDGTWPLSRTTTEGASVSTQSGTYDDLGRALTSTETWSNNGRSYNYSTSTEYTDRAASETTTWTAGARTESHSATLVFDSLGNVAKHTQGLVDVLNVVDAAGRPLLQRDANMAARTFVFEQGLMTSTTQAGETTTIGYDQAGREHVVTDPLGHTTTTDYTAFGVPSLRTTSSFTNTIETFDAAGYPLTRKTGTGTEEATTTFTTGPLGELLTTMLPTGDLYSFGYDVDRKLTRVTPPGGVEQTFAYVDDLRRPTLRKRGSSSWNTSWDANGNSTTTSPLSQTTSTTFDGRGRAAVVGYINNAGPTAPDLLAEVAIHYDGANQPFDVVETYTQSSSISTRYEYDERQRVTRIQRADAPDVLYGYGGAASSLTTTRSVGSGPMQTKTFDGLGRLAHIANGPGQREIDVHYKPGGLLESIDGGDFNELRTYEEDTQRLHSIVLPTATTTYSYDTRGNRLTENVAGDVTSYAYDAADRLTGVRYPDAAAEIYALRGDGARTARKRFSGYVGALGSFGDVPPAGASLTEHDVFSFNGADGLGDITHPLSSTTTLLRTDAAGRVTQHGPLSFEWDAADRLLSTTELSAGKTAYAYDHQNWRVRSTSPTEDRTYVWGASGIEAEGATGGPLAMHTTGAGMVLGVGDEIFGHDSLGSIVMRVPTILPQTRAAFGAWGGVRSTPATGITGDRVGFTGHSNETNGLIYAQQRWLDPTTGRFLSLDPVAGVLAEPLSTHGWTYANANPTRFTDPNGRTSILTPQGKVAVAVAVAEIDSLAAPVVVPGIAALETTVARTAAQTVVQVGDPALRAAIAAMEADAAAKALAVAAATRVVAPAVGVATKPGVREVLAVALTTAGSYWAVQAHSIALAAHEAVNSVRPASFDPLEEIAVAHERKDADDFLSAAGASQPVGVSEPLPAVEQPAWERPAGWRLPRAGTWSGLKGDSQFSPTDTKALGIEPGSSVPFSRGIPDFGQWAADEVSVSDMTGQHGADKTKAIGELAKKRGMTKTEVADWLSDNDYAVHHAGGDRMQVVPGPLHSGVRHSGEAVLLREKE
ncbi:MAG: DNRLRE domain-containing protein [Deltaproteobacteria bacterium]|nr:DNRLRE domain-containing protein [Deltaproteobacteria bacterium]